MEKYEVVIVGAGPAGLKCAEILAKNNKKVIVLEKNPIIGDKVCGAGLTLKDLKLGIPDKIIQKKFKKVLLHTPLQDTEIALDKPFLATTNREDLGSWMAKKARKASAEIRVNSNVTKIDDKKIIVNDKHEIGYEYLVGADGANSIIRKHLGLKTNNFLSAFQYITTKKFKDLEVFIDPENFGPGYIWIFPYKNSTSIGTGADLTKEVKQPIFGLSVAKVRKNFDKWCEDKFDIKKAEFQAFIINYDYQGHEFENKFLIGDAGGFASGLTGEGIYYGIKSGEDVAMKIINKKYKCPNIKHILKVKDREETLLRSFEINKTFTKVEWELFNLILESNWIDEKLIEKMN